MAVNNKIIENTHILIKDDNEIPLSENGLLLIMNVKDNTLLRVPDSSTIREFFKVQSNDTPAEGHQKKNENVHLTYDNPGISEVSGDKNIPPDNDANVHLTHDNPGISEMSRDENIPPDNAIWEHSAIMLLFCLWEDHETLFKSDKIRNETVWKKIADCLQENGYTFTAKQTENKWKNLRKNYIKVKDNNSKSGAPLKKCKYYGEMEEIYGKSHRIQPVAVASSLSQENTCVSSAVEFEEDSCPTFSKKTKIEKHMHILTEHMEKNEEARERRHMERLEFQKEALKTYNDIMNKLLEKL